MHRLPTPRGRTTEGGPETDRRLSSQSSRKAAVFGSLPNGHARPVVAVQLERKSPAPPLLKMFMRLRMPRLGQREPACRPLGGAKRERAQDAREGLG